MSHSVYKICSPSGECLYVGKAEKPSSRERAHKKRFKDGVFSIIQEFDNHKQAAKSERDSILKFKKIGQASFNIQIPSGGIDNDKLIARTKALRLGESFNVKTSTERTMVLNIAKILNLRITTRARGDKTGKANGFTETRIPD